MVRGARYTECRSAAASDGYKRQHSGQIATPAAEISTGRRRQIVEADCNRGNIIVIARLNLLVAHMVLITSGVIFMTPRVVSRKQ